MSRWRLLLMIGVAACGDIKDLSNLGRSLNEQFSGTPISVSLADGILLTVTATDSVLSTASCDVQVGFALRVARALRFHYPDLDELQVVNVAFAWDPDWGEQPLRHARLPTRFKPAAVRDGLQPQDSITAVGSCVAFQELNVD